MAEGRCQNIRLNSALLGINGLIYDADRIDLIEHMVKFSLGQIFCSCAGGLANSK